MKILLVYNTGGEPFAEIRVSSELAAPKPEDIIWTNHNKYRVVSCDYSEQYATYVARVNPV